MNNLPIINNNFLLNNNLLYLLPIYILNRIDMNQLLMFSSGLITGAYLAQNYNLPDVKNKLIDVIEQLKTMEKNHSKDNTDKK